MTRDQWQELEYLVRRWREAYTHQYEGGLPYISRDLGAYVVKHQKDLLPLIENTLSEADKREWRVPMTRPMYEELCEVLSEHKDLAEVGLCFGHNQEYYMPEIEKGVTIKSDNPNPNKYTLER